MAGKYDVLERYLAGVPESSVTLSFQRIEDVMGDRLPPNARGDHAWWANTRNPDRMQARAWLDAGWKVERVDLEREAVSFVRIGG
jgi:hypothetical protein